MNDAEYTLQQTNRERKSIAYQARHKKGGSRSKKCTLPSDHLTAAQKKGLNGEVTTYEMDKPHTMRELKQWPEDIRHEYMSGLLDKYNPNNTMLGEMLGLTQGSVTKALRPWFRISRPRGGPRPAKTQEELNAWAEFLGKEPEPEAQEATRPTPAIITPPSYMSFGLKGTVGELIQLLETGKAMFSGKYGISVALQRCDE